MADTNMAASINHDELISQFCELTSASPGDARQFLSANRWDIGGAVSEYYTSHEEGLAGAQDEVEDAQEEEPYTGPRTLDGRPAPQSIPSVASSSRAAAPQPRRAGGINTLGTMAKASSGHGHDDDDDDDDDDDFTPDEPRDLFAGGEKSALAVQDPNRGSNDPRKVVNDIIKKARANAAREGQPAASSGQPSRFHGSGQTLGGDDAPSQVIPDPTAQSAPSSPPANRVLHLWEDGFSIEDGPLHRFDDAQNAADLAMIRAGRAPLHLMNVRENQQVDVHLQKHDENYKQPTKVWKPFSGSGQRLGSPTPGPSGSSSTTPTPATQTAQSSSSPPEVSIDPEVPAISLRLQLANGTRLPVRFNTTQTIGDVYDFITRAAPQDGTGRSWVLATTFPNKDHTDKSLVLGEIAEFKRGGTAVQKWS